MNFIFIATIGAAIGYLLYWLFEDVDADILEQRLMRFSNAKKKVEKKKRNAISQDIRNMFLLTIEPIISSIAKKQQKVKSMKQMLLEAGMPSNDDDVFRLLANKVGLAILGFLMSFPFAYINKSSMQLSISVLIVIPYALFIIPDFNLKRRAAIRCTEIAYNLPDTLDLLTVCVEAGLGLDMAISRVAEEQQRTAPILAAEFGRVGKEIMSGVPRQDAFRNLSFRSNVPELKTFTALLIQTDKLGTSISQSLRVYSDSVRVKRRQRIETLAAQASVKMIVPMVLFILPSMFVVLLAPAAINLITNFKNSAL